MHRDSASLAARESVLSDRDSASAHHLASSDVTGMLPFGTALIFLDLVGDAALLVDREWRIVAQNLAARAACAATDCQGGGDLLWDAWPALNADAPAALLRRAMATRQGGRLERIPQFPSGSERWLELRVSPHGAGLAIVLRDVTQETRREIRSRLLQTLTAELSAALEPEEVGAVIIGQAMPALGANAGNVYLVDDDARSLVSVAALGYAPDILEQSRILPLDGSTMMADVTRTQEPILCGRWKERVERYPHHHHVHGVEGDRAVAGVPLRVQGRTIGALSLAFPTDRAFDDDERQFIATVAELCAQSLARSRLYAALRRSEAQARLVTDLAPAYLAHITVDGRYEYVNHDFAARLGLTPAEVIGKRVPEVIGDDAYAVIRQNLDAAFAGREIEFEAEVPYAGIGPRFVKLSYAPNRDERGRVHGVVAVIVDLTSRQRAELARQVLADVGAILGASLDPEAILGEIARIAVRGFSSHCVVWLHDRGRLRRVGLAQADGAEAMEPLPPLPGSFSTPEPVKLAPIVSHHPRPSIAIPLATQQHLLGAVQFFLHRDSTMEDLWLATEFAQRCATLLDNSRLYRSLQESEARFRLLADAIPKIAWVVRGDGTTLDYINRRWLDFTGAPLEPLATPLTSSRVHPHDRGIAARRWEDARRTGASFSTEFRLQAANGSYRWFDGRVEAVHDAAGHVVKWFGAATDIDDTKRAEASQRFLAELSGVLAISLDPAEILRRVSRLVTPVLADYCLIDLVQPNGDIRRMAWAHVDPDEQRVLDEHMVSYEMSSSGKRHPLIAQVIELGKPRCVEDVDDVWLAKIAASPEQRAYLKARRLRSLLSAPLRARGRTLGALTLCCTDISRRRYSEDDLDLARDVAERIAFAIDNARLYTESQHAAAKVQRLLDAGVVGIVVADSGRILEANDAFLEMVGASRESLAEESLRWTALSPHEFDDLDARARVELNERGIWTPYEKELVHRDGSRIPVMIGGAILERDPLQWICFVLDLTEQKRGEDEWREFIDATAHDLRNPLTSVLGQAQLLQRRLLRHGGLDPVDAAHRLGAVTASSRRAASLIDDLIDTARLRAGQPLDMCPAPFDLLRLVVGCVDEARRVGRSHTLHVEAASAQLPVLGDEPRLERVVRNMLDNAIKFSPNGGDVTVTAGREEGDEGGWAVVTIADRGLGIPAGELAYVFDPFRRGSNVAGRIHGSGLGLAGAQQIVARHGGQIQVHSTEGEGSIFTLRLPLLPQN